MGKTQSKTDKPVTADNADGFIVINDKNVEPKEKNQDKTCDSHYEKENKTSSESVLIEFEWPYEGNEVLVSGSFNNWSVKLPMQKSSGKFKTSVALSQGTYEYKFIVDGNWKHDKNKDTIVDHFGGLNNVIVVAN